MKSDELLPPCLAALLDHLGLPRHDQQKQQQHASMSAVSSTSESSAAASSDVHLDDVSSDSGKRGIGRVVECSLGRGYRVMFMGVVWSCPGSQGQDWHTDVAPLFPGSGSGPASTSLPLLLPAHALNIFLPLVAMTPELGPTAAHREERSFCPSFPPSLTHASCLTCVDSVQQINE